ncbi:MAG: hypothetical protein QOE72_3726 [Chloroflexota bacterium]|nr:hypothetical protein [Chloroflexota bacterium]
MTVTTAAPTGGTRPAGGATSNWSNSTGDNKSSSQSGSNGSSLIELNNVLDHSLDNLSIHILGG